MISAGGPADHTPGSPTHRARLKRAALLGVNSQQSCSFTGWGVTGLPSWGLVTVSWGLVTVSWAFVTDGRSGS